MNRLVEANSMVNPQTRRKSKKRESRLADPWKRGHVEKYLESGQTPRGYCAAQNIKLSSFKNWKLRYRAEASAPSSGHFKEVMPLKPEKRNKGLPGRIEIMKNDTKVVLSDIEDIGSLIAIIQGVL